MQSDAFMFTACNGAVLGPLASADDPNQCVCVASLCAGECQEFAGKLHLSTENSEEPKNAGQLPVQTGHVPAHRSGRRGRSGTNNYKALTI